jgi:hypothetical protein
MPCLGCSEKVLTIQIISCHQQFEAEIWRDPHVSNMLLVLVALLIIEVLADLLEDDAAAQQKQTIGLVRQA